MYAIINNLTPSRATIVALVSDESPTDEQLDAVGEDRLSYGASWLIIEAPEGAEVGERIWR